MPKLWSETIASHRHAVQEAILDAAWQLVTERGLTSVTMSQIASESGIGRATLYKYFPDVEAILIAWHERHVAGHLEHLRALADRGADPAERLENVLHAYAKIVYHRGHGGADVAALLHRGDHVVEAQQQLTYLFRDLLTDVADIGQLRDDVAPAELAAYCLHALSAAGVLPSEAATRRLVKVTLAGVRAGGHR